MTYIKYVSYELKMVKHVNIPQIVLCLYDSDIIKMNKENDKGKKKTICFLVVCKVVLIPLVVLVTWVTSYIFCALIIYYPLES